MVVTLDERGDCLLLPGQLARQGIDLGLAVRGQGRKLVPIALEKRLRIGRLTASIGGSAR